MNRNQPVVTENKLPDKTESTPESPFSLLAQLKRTIERLLKKNNDMAAVLKTVQRAIAVILADDTTSVEMSLKWETAAGRKEATRKARLIRRAHRRACRAINAENATQGNLLCTDADQLTERKGN